MMNADDLARLLSGAVSPMLVISAAGLLLLSMTNRYGRVIDRARSYTSRWSTLDPMSSEAMAVREELKVVWERAGVLRLAITLSTASVLGVVITVLGLFLQLIIHWPVGSLVAVCFGVSLVLLGASVLAFIRDMTISLRALAHEIKQSGAL